MELMEATHWWAVERMASGKLPAQLCADLEAIIPLMFKTFRALLIIVNQLHTPWCTELEKPSSGVIDGGKNSLEIKLPYFLSDEKYLYFQSALNLLCDVELLTRTLKDKYGDKLYELEKVISDLHDETNRYRPARNFITHIRRHICEYTGEGIRKHGIKGPLEGINGIKYTEKSEGGIYASIMHDTFYFSDENGVLKEKNISKREIQKSIELFGLIYNELTSHKIQARKYTPFTQLFNMELNKNCPQLKGLDFSKEAIETCVKTNSLLRVSFALSKKCNLRCPFCYANACNSEVATPNDDFTFDKIKNIINQVKEVGGKTITLVGGEPTIHPHFKEIVSFTNSLNLTTVIFTNGIVINKELADFLYKNNASLIVKLNSVDNAKIQNQMVGNVSGAFEKIQNTLAILQKVGFNKTTPTRLAIETVISKTNLTEIPKIFKFARMNNIYPYIELVTPAGRDAEYSDIITKIEAKNIFYELLKIDETEFGYTWIPRPPQIASTCKYYFTAVYINSDGVVQPCPTVKIELGNLKHEKLSEILNKPQTKNIRDIQKNIKGKCQTCSYHLECYGCRGAAFNTSGDVFCADPICWV